MTEKAPVLPPNVGVRVQEVWKEFFLPVPSRTGWARLLPGWRRKRSLTALAGVSLDVARGELVGIIGTNGSGKTTLLRTVASVMRPTRGRVTTAGRVGALLDLSGGFHPTLTGWQNLMLGASLAGLTREEGREHFPAMVEFSGLKPEALDRPVREWSAGMIARLGFALAVGIEPEVVVVDEVLAVGDAEFQARSARRLLEFRDQGKSMLMVSHLLGVVRNIADRLVWMDRGTIRMEGPTEEVARAYERETRRRIAQRHEAVGDEAPAAESWHVTHAAAEGDYAASPDGTEHPAAVNHNGRLLLRASIAPMSAAPPPPDLRLLVMTDTGVVADDLLLSEAAPDQHQEWCRRGGAFDVTWEFAPMILLPGNYEAHIVPVDGADCKATGAAVAVPFSVHGHQYHGDVFLANLPCALEVRQP